MASQQAGKSTEEHNAARAIIIDTREMSLSSNPRGGARPHHYSTDQELDTIDKKLYEACGTIETSRKKLYDNRVAIAALEQAVKQENQARLECSQAYKALYAQHGRTLTDLNNMAKKCLSLHRELEEAQQTIHTHESTMGSGEVKNHEIDQADWDMVEPAIGQLQARIRDLEEEQATTVRKYENALVNAADRIGAADRKLDEVAMERVTMIREHESALINAAERIGAADQKLDEFAKEKVDMTQEHQNALTNANNCIFVAEQRVRQYEIMHLASQAADLVQAGSATAPETQIVSPSAGKRQRHEDEREASTQRQAGASQRTRKRRQVAKAKGADSIVG